MIKNPINYFITSGGGGSGAEYNKIYFNASDFTSVTIEGDQYYYINNDFLLGIVPPFTGATSTDRNISAFWQAGGTDYSTTFTCSDPETDTILAAGNIIGSMIYSARIEDNKIWDGTDYVTSYGKSYVILSFMYPIGTYWTIPTDFVLSIPVPNTTNSILASKTISGDYDSFDDGYAGVREVTGAGGGDYGYQRVSGVPDGAALLAAATDITVGEVEYMPIYILINYANTLSNTYKKIGTGVSSGADAYLFSDAPSTLEVGASVAHTWDLDEDIATVEGWKCRWVIAYAVKAGYASTLINWQNNSITFEFIGGSNLVLASASTLLSENNSFNRVVFYYNLKLSAFVNNTCTGGLGYGTYTLVEAVFPDSLLSLTANGAFRNSKVKKITALGLTSVNALLIGGDSILKLSLPNLTTTGADGFVDSAWSITELNLPNLTTISTGRFLYDTYNLKYVDISSVTNIGYKNANFCNYVRYIKLKDGFNISAVNFTGVVTKNIQWFYDLAGWLADRSSGTAGTIILGAANIAILNSLYLEDGTTPLTSIFDAKNWTRS